MKLKIVHLSEYNYSGYVVDSMNEVRLKPRNNYRQHLDYFEMHTEPATPFRWHQDYFKNDIAGFEIIEPHDNLKIVTTSVVYTAETEPRDGYVLKPEDERTVLSSDKFRNRYAEYLVSTQSTLITPYVAEYFKYLHTQCSTSCTYEFVRSLTSRIHGHFKYQPGLTSVSTTVEETIKLCGGVCQDFAHLMLAACRFINVPARYVSGYQYIGDLPENIGNDNLIVAMHAWIEAYIPGAGWLGFDPTNDNVMSWRYAKVADGRDYFDVIPVKGLYRGNATQQLSVAVKIDKIED